jgi:signal transduction histidine kinase
MSLSTRISIVVALLLAAAGTITGIALYDSVRRSLKNELNGRVEARLAWLRSSVDLDEKKLDFEGRPASPTAAANWKITTHDGRVLWSSRAPAIEGPSIARITTIRIGNQNGTLADGSSLIEIKEDDQEDHSYKVPDAEKGVDLQLWAAVSSEPMRAELNRLALAIWTVGPASVILLTALLLLFLRRQLAPLTAMAGQAAQIGPANLEARIGSAGTSAECVKLRESINRMVERLGEGLARERRFASMAAHELRTPLAVMRTNIEVTLRKERDSSEYRSALSEALNDVERLQKLVANLLMLTRNEEGAAHAQNSVQLSQVVNTALRTAGINNSTPQGDPLGEVVVTGDEELLTAAVRNVLENAVQYAPGSAPSLRAERNGQSVALVIADEGPGIPEQERERIFEPLIRLDQARTIGESATGFGLGLTVARSAMRACGGDLSCRGRADTQRGAEFVFTFKLARAPG